MMKRKIRKAFVHQTPDVLHSVLSELGEKGDAVMQQKQDWQLITPKQEGKHLWLKIAAAAAALALVIGLSLIILKQQIPTTPELTQPSQTEEIERTEPTTEIAPESTDPTEETSQMPYENDEWDLQSLVTEFQIAPARAKLVLAAWKNNPDSDITELIEEDIMVLIMMGANRSDNEYSISYQQARQLVLEHAGLENAWNFESNLIDGIYELTFYANRNSYIYTVDANSGEILTHRASEDQKAADMQAAVDVALAFFENFTPMTFLGEKRDLTPYLVPADMEVWANAMDFLPYVTTRCYFDEMYLSNQREYILRYADYWYQNSHRYPSEKENLEITYTIDEVHIKGGFAQVGLIEGLFFNYVGQSESSSMGNQYEIMLVEIDGQWQIFDMATDNGSPQKYENGPQQPPLVTEAYRASYTGRNNTLWQQSLPQVMLHSSYAKEINEKMYELIDFLRTTQAIEDGAGVSYQYEWYVHGDLLTLIVTAGGGNFETTRHIFTLRISDGEKATREEILAYAGVAEYQFVQKTRQLLSYTFATTYTPDMVESLLYDAETSGVEESWFCEIFCKTVCLDNMDDTIAYLNEDGELCLQAKVYQIAGTDYHKQEYLYAVSVEKSQYYDRFMALCYLRERVLFACNIYGDEISDVALSDAGVKRDDVTDLQCRAVYPLDAASYYVVTFEHQGTPYEYFVDTTDFTLLPNRPTA